MHSFLMKQKQMFSDGEELAKSLARIFDTNLRMTDWPDVDCELKQCHVADQYKAKMDLIQNVLRSSSSTVCSEHALDPLRAAIAKMAPEIDALSKERNIKLTDYDSYRRRLKEKETKKEQLDVSILVWGDVADRIFISLYASYTHISQLFTTHLFILSTSSLGPRQG